MMGIHIAPDIEEVMMEKFVKRSSKPKKGCEVSDSELQLRPNDCESDIDDNLKAGAALGDDSSSMFDDLKGDDAARPSGSSLAIGAELEIETETSKGSKQTDNITISKADWLKFQNQNKRILKTLKVMVPDSGKSSKKVKKDGDRDHQQPAKAPKRKRVVKVENEDSSDEENPPKRRVLFESSDDDLDNEFLQLADESDDNDDPMDDDDDQNDQFNELEEIFLRNSETGPPVSARLATLVDAMATGSKCLTEEKLREKEQKYKRPENIQHLRVPKVNPELWNQLDHNTKSQDIKSQRQQKLLLTAVNAMVRTTDNWMTDRELKRNLKKKGSNAREMFDAITDSVSMLLKAVHDVSMDRRNKVLNSPMVNNKYKRLASTEIPITDNLFGDNLKEAMAAIDNSSKLGNNFTKSAKGRKFFPARQSKNYQDYQNRRRNVQWIRGRGRQFGNMAGNMVYPQNQARGRGQGQQIQKKRFAGA